MSSCVNLVAGRLALPGATEAGGPALPLSDSKTSYGILRLGLVRPTARQAPRRALQDAPSPFKKCTFKLPRELAARLKARALTTSRYQYVLVTEAIEGYLDRPRFCVRSFTTAAATPHVSAAESPAPVARPAQTPRKRPIIASVMLAPIHFLCRLFV